MKFECITGVPNSAYYNKLQAIYTQIFEDADATFFEHRFKTQTNFLSVLAFTEDDKLVGFKIGYRYDTTTFYSWVGGVLPNYRQQGIARQLAKRQEQWAKQNGYTKIRTKSMNRFKPMLILNLKNGFDIVKVYTNDKQQTKIVFEKDI